MVVEDDPDIGTLLKRWLEMHGFTVMLATSTKEAMDLVQDVSFIESKLDGLLVDYQLPDATGCRVIQEFVHEFPGVPVAMMTAFDDITLEGWVRARRIELFRKPLDLKRLEQWVHSLPVKA
ncbi:MAG: response regulator [Planctomycetota bacterium]|nr:response regulator [Planctomycetota bacterium]